MHNIELLEKDLDTTVITWMNVMIWSSMKRGKVKGPIRGFSWQAPGCALMRSMTRFEARDRDSRSGSQLLLAAIVTERFLAIEPERMHDRQVIEGEQARVVAARSSLPCSCHAHEGTQKMSRSYQSKRLPPMIEKPRPFAT